MHSKTCSRLKKLFCTIAVDESTPENGALTVQSGSHKIGRLPHCASGVMGFSQTLIEPVSVDDYPEVQLCMQPGDICLHHTNTIHYSGANNSPQPPAVSDRLPFGACETR